MKVKQIISDENLRLAEEANAKAKRKIEVARILLAEAEVLQQYAEKLLAQ